MQKINLIWVGKSKEEYIRLGVLEFTKRLQKFVDLEIIEVSEGYFPENSNIESEIKKETENIMKVVPKDFLIIYLDILGKEMNSEDFAQLLQDKKDSGINIAFVIGGAYGCDLDILKPDLRISFSRMTFTHQLIRLIFLEQLYRGYSIMNSSKFHH